MSDDGAAQRRVLAVSLTTVFLTMMSVSSINVVLPAIQSSISATDSQLQWVLAGYALTFGVVLVPAGRAGDVYGRGRLFVGGIAIFGLSSLIAGLASGGILLDAARLLMGVGSGMVNPQVIGLIQQFFSGRARARAFGSFGAAVGLSVSVGPLMGGAAIWLLGDDLGWRLTFLVNVPVTVLIVGLALAWFPREAFGARRESRADLDPVGVALFTVAMLCLMLPFLERGPGPVVFAVVPVGLALLASWVHWEQRHAARGGQPMVRISLFRIRSFAFGTALIGLQFTGVTSVHVVLALYLQRGHGWSALAAALIGLPAALATGVFSSYAGRRVLEVGRRLVLVGLLVVLASMLASMLVVWARPYGVHPAWLAATVALLGVGQGLVVSPNQTLSLLEVAPADSGAAGGVIQTGQRVGSAIGAAAITAVFFVLTPTHGWEFAFLAAFGLISATVVAACATALIDLRTAPKGS